MKTPFDAMMGHALLSVEKERELLTRYAELRVKLGAEHKRTLRVRNQIIAANMRLIGKYATKFPGLSYEDRVLYGVEGLIVAIERFDVDRGYRFCTYAQWWVKHHVQRAVHNVGDTVRIPVHRQTANHQGRKRDGVSLDSQKPMSLDAPLSTDNEHDLHGLIASEAESAEDGLERMREARRIRRGVLEHLTSREREVIECHFGLRDDAETLDAIGQRLGLSRERIRQIEAEALDKMRRGMVRRSRMRGAKEMRR